MDQKTMIWFGSNHNDPIWREKRYWSNIEQKYLSNLDQTMLINEYQSNISKKKYWLNSDGLCLLGLS